RNSPTFNRIAVAFTREGGSNQIHYLYSDDSGSTWTQPKALGPRDCSGAQVFFLPDGQLGVVYCRFLNGYFSGLGNTFFELVVSPDGGSSFGPPALVQDMRGTIDFSDPIAFAWSNFPSVGTDSQAGVIYIAFSANWPATNSVPRVMFRKS